MEAEALKEYNSLLNSGELSQLFPELKGNWEQDKRVFISQYEKNQKLLSEDLTIDDEYDDECGNEYREFEY